MEETAFRMRYEQCDFLMMPFDLTNIFATFISLMNHVYHPYVDILVHLDNEQDHEHYL